MGEMVEFQYGGYYDFPRTIVLRYRGEIFLLYGLFDEELDEFPDDYSVYRVPASTENSPEIKSWMFWPNESFRYLGQLPIRSITFDPTQRKALDASILDQMIGYPLT